MNKKEFFKFCFNITPEFLPETVIITPFIPLKKFTEHFRSVETFKGKLYSGVIAESGNTKFAVISSGMGACLAADAILLMECAPVRRVIFTGAAGGLGESRIGDIVLSETAFNGEGFSRYHETPSAIDTILNEKRSIPADRTYTKETEEFLSTRLKDKNILKKGSIFTIGSILAETEETLTKIENKNFIGIDLELSSVYQAAKKINIQAVGLAVISDLPKKKPLWKTLEIEDKNQYNNSMAELIKLSTELAAQ